MVVRTQRRTRSPKALMRRCEGIVCLWIVCRVSCASWEGVLFYSREANECSLQSKEYVVVVCSLACYRAKTLPELRAPFWWQSNEVETEAQSSPLPLRGGSDDRRNRGWPCLLL